MSLPLTTDFSYTILPSGGGQGFIYGGATIGNGNSSFQSYFNPQRDRTFVQPTGILPEASGNTTGLPGSLGSRWVYPPTGWNAIVS